MIRKIKTLALYAFAICAVSACAVEVEESSDEIQRRILEAYIAENYPNAEQTASGLTYLSKQEGTGNNVVEMYDAVYVNFEVKTLEGSYSSYNDTDLAKYLGTYSKSNYYGPKLYEIGYGSAYVGVEEMLLGLKKGAKVTAIIPPWLTSTTESEDGSQSSGINSIYTYEVTDVVKDIKKFELDSMASYSKKYLGGVDTVSMGFYYKEKSVPAKADTIAVDDAIKVRYVGRLLDGYVFDTNIRDSAKVHGIYNPDNDYAPLEVTYQEDLQSLYDSSGLVYGFCMGIQEMDYGEWGTAMFYSLLGYYDEGSKTIGPYQSLIFDIYIEPKED